MRLLVCRRVWQVPTLYLSCNGEACPFPQRATIETSPLGKEIEIKWPFLSGKEEIKKQTQFILLL